MITTASYNLDGTITAVIDEVEMVIPNAIENRHRAMLAEWEVEGNTIAPYVDPPFPQPNLTARQLRLGLLSLGKLSAVDTAVSQLPEPSKSEAKVEWEFASTFRRDHPLIRQLIPILDLTDEQVDTVWMEYSIV